MKEQFNSQNNYGITKKKVGYIDFKKATPADYEALGFKCGLEVHQQLKTKKKLFCRCPVGIYQADGEYDAEIIRHMRPTLSELGEYDGTALMEFKTKKNIIYHISNETACTYDIDDTPPFPINREALDIALEVALLSKLNIVGELHITRKQYLDGSIPTGFQRTGIIGIEGEIPLKDKKVRLIQLSVEEDACREVADIGHYRTYTTDRLGIPLIETVTYPDMKTPQEAAEAAQYIRFLARSTGKVRVGIGAAREDVNVSVTGGTRVEIKGVSHISWIPKLTHNEAFRQKALLLIKKELNERVKKISDWSLTYKEIDFNHFLIDYEPFKEAKRKKQKLIAVNLPAFGGVLSFFTQPGQTFADEISGRLKVIACLGQPNMISSEGLNSLDTEQVFSKVKSILKANEQDAQVIFWCSPDDLKTAVETIEERCRMAFDGVPNETRKSLPDGTTVFERVLPGPNRMYPDTDSAPIPIEDDMIEQKKKDLPAEVHTQLQQLQKWGVPHDTYYYILKNNLMSIIERIVDECDQPPIFVATIFAHTLKHLEGKLSPVAEFSYNKVYGLFKYLKENNLEKDIIREMLPVVYEHPNIVFDSVLVSLEYKKVSLDQLISDISVLRKKYAQIKTSPKPNAEIDWIMGQLRKRALGNIALKKLCEVIEKECSHV